MKRLALIPVIFFSLLTSYCLAQSKITEVLTNQSVIELSKAGLDKEVIISKIQSSQTNFDVSTDGLIALKKQKLDNEIIQAMVRKATGGSPVNGQEATTSLAGLDNLNEVYGFNKSTNSITRLESAQANQKTKVRAMGFGGGASYFVIDGEKSPVRLQPSDDIAFVINTGAGAPMITLYKLEISNNTRQAALAKVKGAFNFSSNKVENGNNTISCNVTQLKTGVFQITPATKLQSGEYFFAVPKSMTGMQVYAFGVD